MEEVEMDAVRQEGASFSIIVRDAYKRYGHSNVILKGLCLTVDQGTIYGFLGPSGCGKTTLLNCIVGRCQLDSGSIRISAKRRSEIGFMPQEISLYTDLTVFENFLLFGYIVGMTKEEVDIRTKELISFLEIPSKDRFVNSLSGGQQRRLSIAITLLHDPKIIILDEPTVGIDPILYHQIWQRLLELSERGKSIIITTHYIQEAQQAHRIGLMRNGKLLAEENPTTLLDRYQCDDLENVFLKLIFEEARVKCNNPKIERKNSSPSFPKFSTQRVWFAEDDRIWSKKILKALTFKNYLVMKRGFVHLFFTLCLPLVQTFLFNIAIGTKPQNVPIAVLNNEISLSQCYPHIYSDCFFEYNSSFSSSCLFLKYLKEEKYNIISYHDETKALNDLRSSKVRSVLRFPTNYTKSMSEKISKGLLHNFSDNIFNGFVDVWLDNSNRLNEDFVRYDLTRSLISFTREAVTQCGKNPDITGIPLVFEEPIRGEVEMSFNSYVSCALLISGSFFFASASASLFFIDEKVGGQTERISVYGVTMFEIVLALIFFQYVINLIQVALCMLITFTFFNNPLEGNNFTFICLLMLTTLSGVIFGVLETVISANVTAAAYAGVGTAFILSVTSGMFGPREAQHEILRFISAILPMTWEVDAARKIANRGSAFSHPDVLRGFYSSLAWQAFFSATIIYFTKYKNAR